ncbi:MAG: mechanosensitive ion channel family protein [Acidobacteria bacterium]|nr:mechanosensitive ion channel family protein [Acidobacteriota bacterium]
MFSLNRILLAEAQFSKLRLVWEDWKGDSEQFLRRDVPKIALVVLVAFILLKLLRSSTNRLAKFGNRQTIPPGLRAQQLRTLASVLNSVGMAVILFLAAMQILPVLGINMGPLLASAGVAGLAIGFGAQTLVHDVINGFFILMENQYDIGDTVRIAGVSGAVERMTLRSTMLRDADGTVHTIPNSEIHVVSNLTRDWAQVALHVSTSYTEHSDKVIDLLKQVGMDIRNDPQWSESLVGDVQVPGIERVAAGEVDYLVLAKTRPGDQYAVSRELRRRIKECFEKNNIQPASPARVYVADQLPTPGKPA